MFSNFFQFTKIEATHAVGSTNIDEADGLLPEHISVLLNKCSFVKKFPTILPLGNKCLHTLQKILDGVFEKPKCVLVFR